MAQTIRPGISYIGQRAACGGMALAKHHIYQYNYIAYKQHIEIMTDEQ